MQTPSSDSSLLAPHVCASCKRQKKKCDKVLPRCTTCSKRNWQCEYVINDHAGSCNSDSEKVWNYLQDEPTEAQSIDFPTILFLDPSILQRGQIDASKPDRPVPAHILQLLGDMDEILTTTSKFFRFIHSWMPIVSKKRFYDLYLGPSFQSRADISLLLLCIKLITTLPPTNPRNPQTPLYHAAKQFYFEVERSSCFSIQVLQAGILLALYELGHAIYPAAFLSTGACARYAHALGIDVGKPLHTRRVLTLVEVEERRRVWWAIIILDRFVSIGCPDRPLATPDPGLDDLLPADDALWDQGIVEPDKLFTFSSPMNSHMSKFALLCQAARLLGQVLHHLSGRPPVHVDAGIQLDRTIHSMLAAALDVEVPDTDQITFIYSALVALYTPSFGPDGVSADDSGPSQRARAWVQNITDRVYDKLIVEGCIINRNIEELPPWGNFFAYHICGVHMRSPQQTARSVEVIKCLKEHFVKFDERWNVAGIYLQLLEAQEAMKTL